MLNGSKHKKRAPKVRSIPRGGLGACSPRKILWFSQAQIVIFGNFGAPFFRFLYHVTCKEKM